MTPSLEREIRLHSKRKSPFSCQGKTFTKDPVIASSPASLMNAASPSKLKHDILASREMRIQQISMAFSSSKRPESPQAPVISIMAVLSIAIVLPWWILLRFRWEMRGLIFWLNSAQNREAGQIADLSRLKLKVRQDGLSYLSDFFLASSDGQVGHLSVRLVRPLSDSAPSPTMKAS